MNQQVEHWSNGLTLILFLNLPQGDLVNMRMLRQEKKQEETAKLHACVIVTLLGGLGSEAGTRNTKRFS